MAEARWPEIDGLRAPAPDQRRHLDRNALVSTRARTVYVASPKVASTTMRRVFALLEVAPDARRRDPAAPKVRGAATLQDVGVSRLRRFGLLSTRELGHVLTSPDWIRVAVTRDPYTRLASTWKDRVLLAGEWLDEVPPDTTYNLRSAFRRFVEDLDDPMSPANRDHHFWSQARSLALDSIDYTNLVDVASLPELLDLIAARAGVDRPVVPQENIGLPIDDDALYDAEIASKVETYYQQDFERLGYATRAFAPRADELRLDAVGVSLVGHLADSRERLRDLRLLIEGRSGVRGATTELGRSLRTHRRNRAAALTDLHWPTLPDRPRPTPEQQGFLLRNGLACRRAAVVYVPTPKVATTSMKLALAAIEGVPESRFTLSDQTARARPGTVHDPNVLQLPLLASLPTDEAREMLTSSSWMRVALTRDPYTRLTSAWLHKIFLVAPARALDQFHEWGDGRNDDGTYDVGRSFRAFVDRLVQPGCPDREDRHFSPQVDSLAINAVPYTHVVDVRSIGDLLHTIGERAGIPDFTMPRYNESLPIDARALYDHETVAKAREFYRADFEQFGYDPTLIPPDGSVVLSVTTTALVEELRRYHLRIAEFGAVARDRVGMKGAARQLRRGAWVRLQTASRQRRRISS